MKLKDLQNYTIINATESELLVNWPFNDRITYYLFFYATRYEVLSLKEFVSLHGFNKYFFFIENDIYYSEKTQKSVIQNKKLVKLTGIPYPILVTCAIYHTLLDLKKKNEPGVDCGYWGAVLGSLVSPLTHFEVLSMLKKNQFFEKSSLTVIEGFIGYTRIRLLL